MTANSGVPRPSLSAEALTAERMRYLLTLHEGRVPLNRLKDLFALHFVADHKAFKLSKVLPAARHVMNLTAQQWAVWSPTGHPYPPRGNGATPLKGDKATPLDGDGVTPLSGGKAMPPGNKATPLDGDRVTPLGDDKAASIKGDSTAESQGCKSTHDNKVSKEEDGKVSRSEGGSELAPVSTLADESVAATKSSEAGTTFNVVDDASRSKVSHMLVMEDDRPVGQDETGPTGSDGILRAKLPLEVVALKGSEIVDSGCIGELACAAPPVPMPCPQPPSDSPLFPCEPVAAEPSSSSEVVATLGNENEDLKLSPSTYDFLKDLPADLLAEISVEFSNGTPLAGLEPGLLTSDPTFLPPTDLLPLFDFGSLADPPSAARLPPPLPADSAAPDFAECQSRFAQLGMTPDDVLLEFHRVKENAGGVLGPADMDPFLDYFGELSGRELERLEALKEKKKVPKGPGRKKREMAIRFPSQPPPSSNSSFGFLSTDEGEPKEGDFKMEELGLPELSALNDFGDSDNEMPLVQQEDVLVGGQGGGASSEGVGWTLLSSRLDAEPGKLASTEGEVVSTETTSFGLGAPVGVSSDGNSDVSPPLPMVVPPFQGATRFASLLPTSWSALRGLVDGEYTHVPTTLAQPATMEEEDLD